MRSLIPAIFSLLILSITSLFLQGKTPSDKGTSIEAVMSNGSTLRVKLLVDNVDIVTKYGKLTVPVADIRRIEFTRRLSEERRGEIDTAINDLGSTNSATRSAALKKLIAFRGDSYRALKAASADNNPEKAKLARAALEEILAHVGDVEALESDVIRTAEFKIVGKIVDSPISVSSVTLGDAKISLADMRLLRLVRDKQRVRVEVKGEEHAVEDKWLDTGVDVYFDEQLQVKASGTINLCDDGTGEFTTEPDGRSMGDEIEMAMMMRRFGGGGRFREEVLEQKDSLAPGTLIGRIGRNGNPFRIGSKFKGEAPADGRLYVMVVPASIMADNQMKPSGSYTLTIELGN